MRPDAIPIRPLGSSATLSPGHARTLFGTDGLSGRETVEVVRLGAKVAEVPVTTGEHTRLLTDSLLAITGHLRLAGPLGAVSARPEAVRSRLLIPAALQRAWGMGPSASVVLGSVAVSLPVADGDLALEIDRTLWIGAGRPETARWVAGLSLPIDPTEAEPRESGPTEILRRVITETDVRQAILHHRTLRLRADQIVTPAARSLADEHGVFSS